MSSIKRCLFHIQVEAELISSIFTWNVSLAPLSVEFDGPGPRAFVRCSTSSSEPWVSKSKKIRAARKKIWWHLYHLSQSLQLPEHDNSGDMLTLIRVQINMFDLSGLVDWEETCLPPHSWQTLSLCAQQWVMQSQGGLWKAHSKHRLLTIRCGHTQCWSPTYELVFGGTGVFLGELLHII